MAKKSILFAGAYVFLFIYSIFAQIGYRFVPDLSMSLRAYFGQQYFLPVYCFNLLSFLFTYILFMLVSPLFIAFRGYNLIRQRGSFNPFLFCCLLGSLFLFLFAYLLIHYQQLTYNNVADVSFASSLGPTFKLFILAFKFLPVLCVILYCQARFKSVEPRISSFAARKNAILFLAFLCLLTAIALKLGNRTDLLALGLGLLFVELQCGLTWGKLLYLSMGICAFTVAVYYVKSAREQGGVSPSSASLSRSILLNDYYAPAHMLYGAVAYNYVNPTSVILSNLCNTFYMLRWPLLQSYIMDLFVPGVATRNVSYAFYLFTEGYMFMGSLGFLYNATMFVAGMMLWRQLQCSNNFWYNCTLLGVSATQFANIARSQSAYMLKDVYLVFGPALFILFLSSGLRPKVPRLK